MSRGLAAVLLSLALVSLAACGGGDDSTARVADYTRDNSELYSRILEASARSHPELAGLILKYASPDATTVTGCEDTGVVSAGATVYNCGVRLWDLATPEGQAIEERIGGPLELCVTVGDRVRTIDCP